MYFICTGYYNGVRTAVNKEIKQLVTQLDIAQLITYCVDCKHELIQLIEVSYCQIKGCFQLSRSIIMSVTLSMQLDDVMLYVVLRLLAKPKFLCDLLAGPIFRQFTLFLAHIHQLRFILLPNQEYPEGVL